MKTDLTATITYKDETKTIEYFDYEHLTEQIEELFSDDWFDLDVDSLPIVFEDDDRNQITTELSTTLMHYCFAKGRLSIADFAEETFDKTAEEHRNNM